jgi:hypothetical protein
VPSLQQVIDDLKAVRPHRWKYHGYRSENDALVKIPFGHLQTVLNAINGRIEMKTNLEKLRDVHTVAMSPGNAHADHYLRGMANGLELALAIAEDREPKYIEADAVTLPTLNTAIEHAVNYHGLDARLNMSDTEIAELITPEVQKHLDGKTDVQRIEAINKEGN